MLANLKISRKLLLGFGIILAMLAVVSIITTYSASRIQSRSQFVNDVRYKNALDVIGLINLAEGIHTDLKSAADSANEAPLDRASEHVRQFDQRLRVIADASDLDEGVSNDLQSFEKAFRTAYTTGAAMAKLAIEQDFIEYISLQKDYVGQFDDYQQRAKALEASVSAAMSNTLQEINDLSQRTVNMSILLSALGLLVGVALATLISRDISQPMVQVVQMTRELGEGNLFNRLALNRNDEIGQVAGAMDDMADKLAEIVKHVGRASHEIQHVTKTISSVSAQVDEAAGKQAGEVTRTTEAIGQINTSAEEVAKGVEHLSRSAGEGISSVLEMTSSIEEVAGNVETLGQSVDQVNVAIIQMADSIRRIDDNVNGLKMSSDQTASSVAQMDASIMQVEENARETAQISVAVREDAEAGKASVDATIKGIDEILRSAQTTAVAVRSLSAKAQDIDRILSVIDDVTSQTNLLALNAAIIASQAGEHGKGFAVVAEEVRGLAQRTSLSTREISQMIQDVQDETQKAVEAIALAEQSITEGARLSQKSGDALVKIVEGVQKSSMRMDHIARATLEQGKGSRAIRDAIEQISKMADETAMVTREQAGSAKAITAAAAQMKDLTHQVRSSTREQTIASKTISQAMEEINALLREIHAATQQQRTEGQNIGSAVDGIQRSAADNLASTRMLREAVASLSQQSGSLQQEMEVFKLDRPQDSGLTNG